MRRCRSSSPRSPGAASSRSRSNAAIPASSTAWSCSAPASSRSAATARAAARASSCAALFRPRKLFPVPLNDPELFTATPRWQQFLRDDPLRPAPGDGPAAASRASGSTATCASCRSTSTCRCCCCWPSRTASSTTPGRAPSSSASRRRTRRSSNTPGAHHTLEFEPDPRPLHRRRASAGSTGRPAARIRLGRLSHDPLERLSPARPRPHARVLPRAVTIFWVYGFPLILALLLGLAFTSARPEAPAVDVAGDADPSRAAELAATLKGRRPDGRGSSRGGMPGSHEANQDLLSSSCPENEASRHTSSTQRADAVPAPLLGRRRRWCGPWSATPPRREDRSRDHRDRGSRYIDFLLTGPGRHQSDGRRSLRPRLRHRRHACPQALQATHVHAAAPRDFLLAMLSARLLFLIPEMFSLLVVARLMFGVPSSAPGARSSWSCCSARSRFRRSRPVARQPHRQDRDDLGPHQSFMLPMYLLSGVFFSSRRFPDVVQPLIQALPLTQLNDAPARSHARGSRPHADRRPPRRSRGLGGRLLHAGAALVQMDVTGSPPIMTAIRLLQAARISPWPTDPMAPPRADRRPCGWRR